VIQEGAAGQSVTVGIHRDQQQDTTVKVTKPVRLLSPLQACELSGIGIDGP
jgi:hypothetical protein